MRNTGYGCVESTWCFLRGMTPISDLQHDASYAPSFPEGHRRRTHGQTGSPRPAMPCRPVAPDEKPFEVASYYFGNYHPGDPRNTKNKGKAGPSGNWSRRPGLAFPGHRQPKVPLWGYEDESDPKVMAREDRRGRRSRHRRLHLRLVLLRGWAVPRSSDRRGISQGPEQPPAQVCLHVGQPRLAGDPALQAQRTADVLFPGKVTPKGFAGFASM